MKGDKYGDMSNPKHNIRKDYRTLRRRVCGSVVEAMDGAEAVVC